jgi:hypothetical protein
MDARGCRLPQLPIGVDERLDLTRGEVEALFAQGGERFEGLQNEPGAQLFVGDYLTDQRLNCFLRHGLDPRLTTAQRSGHTVRSVQPVECEDLRAGRLRSREQLAYPCARASEARASERSAMRQSRADFRVAI